MKQINIPIAKRNLPEEEVRILILEDVESDVELMEYELRKGGIVFSSLHVQSREAFMKALSDFRPDIILGDYALPLFDGISALSLTRQQNPDVPFILVSQFNNEELAAEAFRLGATDYVLKHNLSWLFPSVIRALRETKEKTKQKQIEKALQHRVEMEKLITSISARFINLQVEEIDSEIYQTLQSIGRFTGVDRSYLFLFSADGRTMNNTHEWCNEGIRPQIQNLKGLSADTFPWWAEKLRRFEIIHIPRIKELPAEASAEMEILQSQGILSLVSVPLVFGTLLMGFLGFDSVKEEKSWTDEDIRLLKMVGEIFVNALLHKKAEERLLFYQGKLRSLASEVSLIEERERRRIANDIHDHIGQSLALSKIKLSALRESLFSEILTKYVDDTLELITEAIEHTHSLVFELSPPLLYKFGFEAAVEFLAEQVKQQHGILIELDDDKQEKPLTEDAKVLLFKIVRELLMNIVRHAQTEHAGISIRKEGQNMLITVEDSGKGFDPSWIDILTGGTKGFGLFNVRERIRNLGGTVEILSRPGNGTRVILQVPLNIA